jgi:hypothetical protein
MVSPPAITVTYFFSQISQHPTVAGSVSILMSTSSQQAGSLHYYVSSTALNARLHLTLYLQVIIYGVGLATYAWRYASKPKQLLADGETGGVQPGLPSDPVSEPLNSSSSRHLSEITSPLPSASVRESLRESLRESHRESARKSRLERRPLF